MTAKSVDFRDPLGLPSIHGYLLISFTMNIILWKNVEASG